MNSTFLKTLRLSATALVVGFVLLASSTSRGELIKYSWRGVLEPKNPAVDPWEIGAAGRGFVISATVDLAAPLMFEAFFVLSDAELLIDGLEPAIFHAGRLFLGDGEVYDGVNILLDEIEVNGVTELYFTEVRLPTSTFDFTTLPETPPVFPPTMITMGGGGVSGGSSYATITEAGSIVTATVIPEPSTFVITLVALLSLMFYAGARNRRVRRVPSKNFSGGRASRR